MIYKDSTGKEIREGDSLMDLTPGFVGEVSEVFLDENEGELAVNQDGTTIYLYEMNTEVNSLIVDEETMGIEKEEDDDEEDRDRIIKEAMEEFSGKLLDNSN